MLQNGLHSALGLPDISTLESPFCSLMFRPDLMAFSTGVHAAVAANVAGGLDAALGLVDFKEIRVH